MKDCKACGAVNSESSEICYKCGEELCASGDVFCRGFDDIEEHFVELPDDDFDDDDDDEIISIYDWADEVIDIEDENDFAEDDIEYIDEDDDDDDDLGDEPPEEIIEDYPDDDVEPSFEEEFEDFLEPFGPEMFKNNNELPF